MATSARPSADDTGVARSASSPARRRRVGTRRFVQGLVVLGVALTPLPYLDADGMMPIVQAVLPVVGLLGIAVTLGALAIRARRTAFVAAAASLALLAPVLPISSRPDAPAASTSGPDLTVLAVNTEFGGADPDALVEAVDDLEVDVLVLTEVTPTHWHSLMGRGLGALLPHATGVANERASGTVVATRREVQCLDGRLECGQVVEGIRAPDEPFHQIDVRLTDGTVLRGAHPFPPGPGGSAMWRTSMNRLQAWVHDTHGDEPRLVVAGDLNASPAHPAFRDAADGLVQAPRALPWQATWPLGSRIPAFVQIDHVLARGHAVVDEGSFLLDGTDHAAVWARLRPLG